MHDEYLDARVTTAPPQQLHMMVVDGAVRFAKHAKQALEEEDIETAHLALNRSREFVSELISGIQDGQSPELAERMKALFGFVYTNLAVADMEREPRAVADALKILEMHQETWRLLCEQLKTESKAALQATPSFMQADDDNREGGFSVLS